jgi:catechol 2,3-dioxygenase-like lactoylglutathione lyase family enzyme
VAARRVRASLGGLTLHVRDVERSRDFYRKIPSFKQVAHRPGQFALFEVGDGLLGLLQLPKPGFHVEIDVSDLDEMYRRLAATDLQPSSLPRDRPWGERTINLVDPDGYVLELQEG